MIPKRSRPTSGSSGGATRDLLAEVARRREPDDVILHFTRTLQQNEYSCGVHCARMILAYFGAFPSLGYLGPRLGCDEDGTSQSRIVACLREYGLRCKIHNAAVKKTLTDAIDAGRPVLAIVDGDHFVNVFGYGQRHVYLADPAYGRQEGVVITWKRFFARWNRDAVVVGGSASRPGAGLREHEVECPEVGQIVRVTDEPADYLCPHCEGAIASNSHGALHQTSPSYSCPVTGETGTLEEQGNGIYECEYCEGDVVRSGAVAKHERMTWVTCPRRNIQHPVATRKNATFECPACGEDIVVRGRRARHT